MSRTRDQVDASRRGCRCSLTNGWVLLGNGVVPCMVGDHTEGWPKDLRPDSRTEGILREEFKCGRCKEPITRLEMDPRALQWGAKLHSRCEEG